MNCGNTLGLEEVFICVKDGRKFGGGLVLDMNVLVASGVLASTTTSVPGSRWFACGNRSNLAARKCSGAWYKDPP